jgi:hypothetical protein
MCNPLDLRRVLIHQLSTPSYDPFSTPGTAQDPLSEFRDFRHSNTPQMGPNGDWSSLPALGQNQMPYRSSSPFPLSYPTGQQRHSPSRSHSLSLPHPSSQTHLADRSTAQHMTPHSHSQLHWPIATPLGYNYTEEPKAYPPVMGTGTGGLP